MSRSRGRTGLLSAAAAVAVACWACPAVALAAGSAADEYTLDVPGIRDAPTLPTPASPTGEREQAGVAGETEPVDSPLAAASKSFLIPPVLLVLLLMGVTAWKLLGGPRRARGPQ
jgi:hypothetical protein